MQKTSFFRISAVLFLLLLLLGASVWAQQLADRPKQAATRSLAYDATQETVMEGTDLHLGGASYLQANHFSLQKGDSVRVVGVNSATREGSVFLVRVIQKGGQSLNLRTPQGTPLAFAGARAVGVPSTPQQGGAR
jgi:hypothetical protein